MLSVKDIKYEVIEQDNFIEKLSEYPKNRDIAFDYETYNDVNGGMAVEPWDENTHPFMFSMCCLDDPENTIRVFNFNELTQEQKAAFEEFLTSRRVWAFNCKFEGAVTWKLLGKLIKFDDVQCLYKVSGGFVDGLSLKKGTASLFNVTEWADDTWETLSVLREIVSRVQETYVKKSKTNEWVDAFLEGNIKRIVELINKRNISTDKITKEEAEFIASLHIAMPHLTPNVVLNTLILSGIDANRVNLKYVPSHIVERYCAYDSLATTYNYQKLYEGCKEQYHIYLKQSWLAMLMEAYGMTRDLVREKEIETHYQEQILHYMKEILSIPEFTDNLRIAYIENRINPESGRLKNFTEYRTGFELEDHKFVKETTDYKELNEKYWNYNSSHKDKLELFYNALFSSDMAKSAVVSYHIKKYLVQLEGFSEIIDGQEISKAKRVKWHNIAELYPAAVKHVNECFQTAKTSEEKRKWANISHTLEKTYKEAVSLQIAPTSGERAKLADIEDIRLSLKKENVEILFSALNECADISPDAPWDTFPWEMKMVFCCKVIKKLDKALTAWVRGKVGRDRIRKCQFGKSLLDVPKRTEQGDNPLFQTSFNDCSAETKRWKSPIHAIPRGSELSEMIVPRCDDSILVHYDYCWHKDTKIRLLNDQIRTIEELYLNPKKYAVNSYSSTLDKVCEGTIKEVRRVRKEKTLLEITLSNGYVLLMTKEHNIYLEGYKKTKASDLRVGDNPLSFWKVVKRNARPEHGLPFVTYADWIISIREVEYNDWVYTIEIEEYHHNYFVVADHGEFPLEMILSSNSQAEVRVIAALAQENNLTKLFKDNPKADVHRLMASKVWNKKPEDISGEERRASKACTFGILYGQNTESLANSYFDGNVTTAKDIVSKFYKAYPKILKWCNERHKQIDKYGYVNTLFGDKIYIESKSRGERHRRSQNYPVQSSSSNIAGYGIWKVWEHCQLEGIEAIPQCFIHDSSDWDVRLKDLIRFIKAVNKCAVDDIVTEFDIPMKIDFEIGINLNFTMHIENPEFTENGVKFSFKCPEIFHKKLLKRLQTAYTLKGEIVSSKPETESWANIFVTKRPYSMYLNRPINIYEGNLTLEHK